MEKPWNLQLDHKPGWINQGRRKDEEDCSICLQTTIKVGIFICLCLINL